MINYTNEQKVEIFDHILGNVRKGDQREIIRDLQEKMGWQIPQEMRQEIEDYDRYQQGLPPAHYQQPAQHQDYISRAEHEAALRQSQGANYNSPQVIEANKLVQDKLKELDDMKKDLIKTKEAMTSEVKSVENTILADRYNNRIQSEIKSLKDSMPGLKHLDQNALIETVKTAKANYYKEHKEILETEDILKHVHNEQAKAINSYIDNDEKKIKLFEDEAEEQVIKDTEGNVVGKLNEEGNLVKTLTKADTVADNVKSEPKAKAPVLDHTGEKHQEVLKDGTIRINDEVDPDQLVRAIDNSRPDQEKQIAAIVEQDFKEQAAQGGDNGTETATADS